MAESVRVPNGTWIVVPAYNEEARIAAVLSALGPTGASIVCVDDGSTDGTAREILKTRAWLLVHCGNLGQGAAIQTGISFALLRGARYIVTFDADGQHSVEDIPALLHALDERGADFALGSRFLGNAHGIPRARKLALRLAVFFSWFLSGVRLSDAHNGLRAMTRKGAGWIRISLNRMEHASQIVEQIAASGLKFVEVPVTIRYTAATLAKGQKTSAALRLGLNLLLDRIVR